MRNAAFYVDVLDVLEQKASDRPDGLRDMEKALREALSVQRANAFIRSLPGG